MDYPEYVFGGNGMVEREEYDTLTGESLHNAAVSAVIDIETMIIDSYKISNPTYTAKSENGVFKRSFSLDFMNLIPVRDAFMIYDRERGGVQHWSPKDACVEQHVAIYHEAYSEGFQRERYYIIFDNLIVQTDKHFTSYYEFDFYPGKFVNTRVTETYDSVENEEQFTLYDRPMNRYDFTLLQKQIKEVEAHANTALLD